MDNPEHIDPTNPGKISWENQPNNPADVDPL